MIEKLEDIQLAVLACRLFENDKEKPVLRKLVEDYFIKTAKLTNDVFLHHIGYNILKEHVNSINALYDFSFEES